MHIKRFYYWCWLKQSVCVKVKAPTAVQSLTTGLMLRSAQRR